MGRARFAAFIAMILVFCAASAPVFAQDEETRTRRPPKTVPDETVAPTRRPRSTSYPKSSHSPSKTTYKRGDDTPSKSTGTGSHTPGVIRIGPDYEKAMALTLDDGWNPNDEVLQMISDYGLRGTAFLVGTVAESLPDLPKRLAEMGWEVCSHTYSHAILTKLSEGAIRNEILKGKKAVEKASGQKCNLFRPPGGDVDGKVVAVAHSLGLKVIHWTTSLSDTTTKDTDPQLQIDIAVREIKPGAILLGHFGGVHTLPVLREVLNSTLASGYRIGKVSELLDGTTPAPRTFGHPLMTPAPFKAKVTTGPVAESKAVDLFAPVVADLRDSTPRNALALAIVMVSAMLFAFVLSAWMRKASRRKRRRPAAAWERPKIGAGLK